MYLNCGLISQDSNKSVCSFSVTKFLDVINIIIPYFEKYPLQGTKKLDFINFCQVAELMKNKTHLTNEGLSQIIRIVGGMNQRRS
jgi:hypothetical protein